jgi:uncharacterized membrane protein
VTNGAVAKGAAAKDRAERGSVSVFAVFFTIIVLSLMAMLVDLGSVMNAKERAADIAEQAARAGAEALNLQALRSTGAVQIDQPEAFTDAQNLVVQYKSLSHIDAALLSLSFPVPREVTATVSVTTTPIFGGFGFLGHITEKARESACAEFGITTGAAC